MYRLFFFQRKQTGAELTESVLNMYLNEPVENWGSILSSFDLPSLRSGMCAMMTTAMTLFFPDDIIDEIIDLIISTFEG
jgi:hypothetical protein